MNDMSPPIRPDRLEQHKLAADRLRDQAIRYADAVQASGGRFTETTEFVRWQLCNAIIDLIDDGEVMTERENLMDDLRIDEQGDPVRDELVPIAKLLRLTEGQRAYNRSDLK